MTDNDLNQSSVRAISTALIAVVDALKEKGSIDENKLRKNMSAAIVAMKLANDHPGVFVLEILQTGFEVDNTYDSENKPKLKLVPIVAPEKDK